MIYPCILQLRCIFSRLLILPAVFPSWGPGVKTTAMTSTPNLLTSDPLYSYAEFSSRFFFLLLKCHCIVFFRSNNISFKKYVDIIFFCGSGTEVMVKSFVHCGDHITLIIPLAIDIITTYCNTINDISILTYLLYDL